MAGVLAGQSVLIAFGAMGLAMTGVSWLWGKVSLEGVTYERILPRARVFIGESTPMSVVITNRKPVPLAWVKTEDNIPDAASIDGASVLPSVDPHSSILEHRTSIGWYERVRWDYSITFSRRGYYRIGPARVDSGDIFGLFDTRRRFEGGDSILVYPSTIPLADLGLDDGRPIGDAAGGPPFFQDPSRPSGIRQYRPGDETRSIDWKATAKGGNLMVRTFSPSLSATAIVAVSVETSEKYWRGYSPELLERAVTVGASLAAHYAHLGFSLGLITNGVALAQERPMEVTPSRSPRQVGAVLEALATLGSMPLSPMSTYLSSSSGRLPMGATLVVVAAHCDDGLGDVLSDLGSRGHPTALVYVGDGAAPNMPASVDVREVGETLTVLTGESGA